MHTTLLLRITGYKSPINEICIFQLQTCISNIFCVYIEASSSIWLTLILFHYLLFTKNDLTAPVQPGCSSTLYILSIGRSVLKLLSPKERKRHKIYFDASNEVLLTHVLQTLVSTIRLHLLSNNLGRTFNITLCSGCSLMRRCLSKCK